MFNQINHFVLHKITKKKLCSAPTGTKSSRSCCRNHLSKCQDSCNIFNTSISFTSFYLLYFDNFLIGRDFLNAIACITIYHRSIFGLSFWGLRLAIVLIRKERTQQALGGLLLSGCSSSSRKNARRRIDS